MKHLFQFLASFAVAVIICLTISPKVHADNGQECKEGQIIDVWESPRGTIITYCQDPNEIYLRTEGKY